MSESFAELFEQSLAKTEMKPGSIVEATVVDIGQDFVTLHAGLKSESIIDLSEFKSADGTVEVAVGDLVEVVLEALENGFGETRLSREKAKRLQSWAALEKAQQNDETITGMITGRVKGGFTVDINHVRAFLPGSLVDVRPFKDTSHLEGKEHEFKVIKMDEKRNNVVVSRRAVVEQEYIAEREAMLERLEEGMVVKGYVKNLTDYGAFIDISGIDGLLHITEMAWRRVKNPAEIVAIGEEIEVKVLKVDRDKVRVSLGLKQLGEDPWAGVGERYPVGARVEGKVTNLTDYGCFVEIHEGIEGLVHVSEMDWTNKNINPSRKVQVGQEVQVQVLDIDPERRRISLGIKQCLPNPWEEFALIHKKGDRVGGKIKSLTDFGLFLGLEGNIDGLVHLSDLSWDEAGEEAVKEYSRGDDVEAVVLSVDPERQRISLGIKQLETDAFSDYVTDHPKGTIVNGKVIEVDQRFAKVEVSEGVVASLKAADVSRDRVTDVRTVLKDGDEIEVKIVSVDRKSRSLTVSIRAKDDQEEADAMKSYSSSSSDVQKTSAPATLGDLLKEQMANRGE